MQKSKILALLLAVAMVVSMVVVPAYAEGEGIAFTLTADKTTVAPGEPVVVTLSMPTNAGFGALGVGVQYEGLTYTSGENLCALAGALGDFSNNGNVVQIGIIGIGNVTGTGDLLRITFTAPETDGTYTLSMLATGDLKADDNSDLPEGYVDLSATLDITVETPVPYACPEHEDVTTWTVIEKGIWTGGALAEGHYKLAGDQTVTSELTIAEDTEVCIDLNGFKITTTAEYDSGGRGSNAGRVFNNSGTLTVQDSTGGAGKISNGAIHAGAGVTESGGNILNNANAVFNLYSGTIDNGQIWARNYNTTFASGGNIHGAAGSVINIYGGTVSNGRIPFTSYSSDSYGRFGANISTYGTLNIAGGTITGGKMTLSDSSTSRGRMQAYFGGNIAVLDGATLNITGGTISDGLLSAHSQCTGDNANVGTMKISGGNLFIQNAASATIKNATITGGTLDAQNSNVNPRSSTIGAEAYTKGGNIYCVGTDLTIENATITEGEITGNSTGVAPSKNYAAKVQSYGGNIYFEGAGKTLNLNSATVSNGVAKAYAVAGANHAGYYVNVSHNDTFASGGNIYVADGTTLNITGASEISGGMVDTTNDYISSAVQAFGLGFGGNIYGGKVVVNISGTSKVKDGAADRCGGNIYITGTDADNKATVTMRDSAKVTDGYLCDALNTETLITKNHNLGPVIFVENTNFYAYDNTEVSAGHGGRAGQPHDFDINANTVLYLYGGNMGIVFGSSAGRVEAYNGNFKAQGGTAEYTPVTVAGCSCYSESSDYFKVFQLHLDDNNYCATCEKTYSNPVKGTHAYEVIASQEEGVPSTVGACTNCGHTPSCGHEDHASATWYVFSERPSRDVAGHYVMVADENYASSQLMVAAGVDFCLDMNGCTFDQGWVYNSARAFSITGNATIFGGGTISCSGGGATGGGSIIALSTGNTEMYDITIIGSSKTGATTGSVQSSSGTVYFENCTFKDGTTETSGGNLHFSGGSGTLKNCVISGGTSKDGGNVSIGSASSVVEFDNCQILDGSATQYGGNVALLKNANVTFTDCIITGGSVEGTGNQRGGNIYSASNGAEIVIDGGVIADGVAGAEDTTNGRGGNIFVQRGWDTTDHYHLTVTGGAIIKNGTATNDGGNISAVYASFDLDDCQIFGGYAPDGDNIDTTSSGEGCTIVFGSKAEVTDGTVNLAASSTSETYPAKYTFESGALVEELQVASTNMVVIAEAGVTYTGDVLPHVTNHFDGETETYVTKASAADAIAAVAGTGDTVTLGKAETVGALTVDNFVLDLAGQTLTADSITAYDSASKVIDSVGGGKLACADVALYKDNGYLPVATEGGYYLEVVELKQKVDVINETTKKLKFIVADAAADTYLDTCIKNGDEVKFFVTVAYDGGSVSKYFPVENVLQYVGENGANWGTKMLTCTVKGLDKVTNATFTASIVANGVEIAAVDITG